MSSYQYIFTLKELSKTFPNGKKCFENITLSFLPGVKIGLVGVNGAGKSTLLRMISGLESIDQGEIYLDTKLINNLISIFSLWTLLETE